MNKLNHLAGNIWRMFFFVNAAIWFVLFYPAFYFFCTNEKRFPRAFLLKKFFARMIMYMAGIRYKITIEEKLDPGTVYVFCPNHTSYLDIVVSYAVLPIYFHMMAKAELKKVPLFNVFFIKMDIPVDRGSMRGSHRAFIRSADDIDKGISLVIFPEATIPHHAPVLGRFKNGPFRLAIEKQVALVPVTYKNNWVILPDGKLTQSGGRPGVSEIVVHKPIQTNGKTLEDIELLKQKVANVINHELGNN